MPSASTSARSRRAHPRKANNRTRPGTHVSGTMCLLAMCVPCGGGEAVSLSASTTSPAVNQTFTVHVTLSGAAPFSCWGQALRWDTGFIELISQHTGEIPRFIADSRSLTEINASGEVRTGGYHEEPGSPSPYPDNAGGSGTVAVFTFRRTSAGTTQLTSPLAAAGSEFGWRLLTASGSERTPPAPPAALVLTDPIALPMVSIAATDSAASEPGDDTAAFTLSRTGPTTAGLPVALAWSGTATAGSDYVIIANSVIIPAGQRSIVITLVPSDDDIVESPETVIATVQPGQGYVVGSSGSASVAIADAPPPGSGETYITAVGSAGGCGAGGLAGLLLAGLAGVTLRRRHS